MMTPERIEPGRPTISFDAWKLALRKDCERNDKLFAYNAFGDSVLRILWERGIDPTCAAIIGSAAQTNKQDPE